MPSRVGPIGTMRAAARWPVPVEVTGGPLLAWMTKNRDTTLPHVLRMLEEHGALNNLRRIVQESNAERQGMRFSDSDVYKSLEAVAWSLASVPDAGLRAWFDETVGLLERVQDDDGYLNSFFQDPDERERWSWFEHGHELYCLGHLVQAAIAAVRALGDHRLLTVALRMLDDVHARFGSDSRIVCGHPIIEMALVELWRLTRDERHLDLARAMIDRRGYGTLDDPSVGSAYFQDDVPARDSFTMRGHAVRALYLASGMTDAVLEVPDAALAAALERQWDDLVTAKLYVTGGAGARHEGEAFGEAFELPNDRAYAETCAAVGVAQWAWRMHLATGRADVLDVFDTALWNAIAVGVSESGTEFFYSNPLHVRDGGRHERTPWFSCACCPPNVSRLIASMHHSLVSTDGARLYIGMLASMQMTHEGVMIEVVTDYPHSGSVTVRTNGPSNISIRVPAWSRPRVCVDENERDVEVADGWLQVPDERAVRIDVGLHARVVTAHPRVDASRGQCAIARGPIVYCMDAADGVVVPDDVTFDSVDDEGPATWLGPMLHARGRVTNEPVALMLRPYATWGNAEAGSMRVWIPASREAMCASS